MGIYLAFEKLKTSTAAGADMAEFILITMLSDKSGGITTTNDNNSALFDSFNGSFKEGG